MEWAKKRGSAGSLLWLARDKAGLTQAQLAERAGVPQTTISAYERGARQPTMALLERFLKAAGFEMRIHLTPYDDHDDVLAEWEATLTPEQLANAEAELKALWAAGHAQSQARLKREQVQ